MASINFLLSSIIKAYSIGLYFDSIVNDDYLWILLVKKPSTSIYPSLVKDIFRSKESEGVFILVSPIKKSSYIFIDINAYK